MYHITSVDNTGKVIQKASSQFDSVLIGGKHPAGFSFIESEPPTANSYFDFTIDGWVEIPPQTSKNHVFNWETKQWEDPRTLADHKLAKWEEIKAARYQEEISGLLWEGSTFDSDTLSQQRIAGAVQLAMIAQMASQPYSITWTLSNGSFRTLTAQEMVNVGVALGVHVQTIFNKGQLLQQGIEVATTVSQVEAITW